MRCLNVIAVQILVGICALSLRAAEPEAKAAEVLKFKWAFLLRGEDGNARVVDFRDNPAVKKGDALRIYLEPVTNVYLYLYLFDAQKALRCLFPPKPGFYETEPKPGVPYLLPDHEKWFIMDEHKGTERFYLLASSMRVPEIESLTRKLAESPGDEELKARLLDEIQLVRRAKNNFTTPVEKGVPIAGTVVAITRGTPGDATLTEAPGFYARTLRIEHE